MSISQIIAQTGFGGIFIAALFGLLKQWWVPGWLYRAREDDIRELKDIIRQMQDNQSRQVHVAEHVAEKVVNGVDIP